MSMSLGPDNRPRQKPSDSDIEVQPSHIMSTAALFVEKGNAERKESKTYVGNSLPEYSASRALVRIAIRLRDVANSNGRAAEAPTQARMDIDNSRQSRNSYPQTATRGTQRKRISGNSVGPRQPADSPLVIETQRQAAEVAYGIPTRIHAQPMLISDTTVSLRGGASDTDWPQLERQQTEASRSQGLFSQPLGS